jgi:Kelch motif
VADITDRALEALLRDTLRTDADSLPLRVRVEDVQRQADVRRRRRSYRMPGILAFVALLLLPVSFILTSGGAGPAGELQVPRARETATVLADGRVLVTGGDDGTGALASAEIYDPASGRSHMTGSMSEPRFLHTATLLDDGRVLVVGGSGADLYDPASGTFRRLDEWIGDRYGHSATKLADGRVLIIGGDRADPESSPVAAIFDPTTETFVEQAPPQELLDRLLPTVVPLDDHQVLVVGGRDRQHHYLRRPSVIYDLATDHLSTLPFSPLAWTFDDGTDPRAAMTAAPLPDGRVLMVVQPDSGPSHQLRFFAFQPASRSFDTLAELPIADGTGPMPTAVMLTDGQVIFLGSGGDLGRYQVYRFDPAGPELTLVSSIEGDSAAPGLVALPDGGALVIASSGPDGPPVSRVTRIEAPR